MKQPIKNGKVVKKSKPKSQNAKRSHKNYGISKLEHFFATEYLDKLGLKYIYQFEAKEIKRFFDFAVLTTRKKDYITEEKDGLISVESNQIEYIVFLIEVDGGYYHSDPRVVNENKLNPMQKRNQYVDKVKDMWAANHYIPLLRLWEEDIRHNSKLIFDKVEEFMCKYDNIKQLKKKKVTKVLKKK